MKDTIKKKGDMEDMKMANMDMPKANIGNIKTIVNNIPPRTVRYDLYIADTTVTLWQKIKKSHSSKRADPHAHTHFHRR